MKHKGKRTLSLLVAILLLVTILPQLRLPAAANGLYAAETVIAEGTCGGNLSWTLSETGTLTISGSGPMSISAISEAPWSSQCSSIRTVTISDGITSIGYKGFYNCINLTTVTIPNSVSYIGEYAFYGCSSLISITFPESSNLHIGEYAFWGCSSLTTISFLGSAPSFADTCFGEITATAYYPCNIKTWTNDVISNYGGKITWKMKHSYVDGVCVICQDSKDATIVLFGDCGTDVRWELDSLGTLTISGSGPMKDFCREDGTCLPTTIWFFYHLSITKIVIKNGVTTIGNYAFADCCNVTSVTIPESVTSIGECAFCDCTSLTRLTIPESVTTIKDEAFAGCSNLIRVTISENITTIGRSSFYNCTSLTDVTFPVSMTSIGITAFQNCRNLNSITFLGSAPSIHKTSFSNVTAMAYHPCNDQTWTDAVNQNYDGNITWSGHIFSDYEIYQDATCTQNAMAIGTCSDCGATETVAVPGTATGHRYSQYGLCQNCGDGLDLLIKTRAAEYAIWDDWCGAAIEVYADDVLLTKATVSSYSTFDEVTIPRVPGKIYTFKWVSGSNDSCCFFEIRMNGKLLAEGTGSNYSDGEVIYKLENTCIHQYEIVTIPPTCTDFGVTTYTCTACGNTIEEMIPATGHDYQITVVPVSCTGYGYEFHQCQNCGDNFYKHVTSPTGHCYENGICTGCGEAEPRTVPGDVNGDGTCNIADVAKLYTHCKGSSLLDSTSQSYADINGDGRLNIADTARLYSHVKGTDPLK